MSATLKKNSRYGKSYKRNLKIASKNLAKNWNKKKSFVFSFLRFRIIKIKKLAGGLPHLIHGAMNGLSALEYRLINEPVGIN